MRLASMLITVSILLASSGISCTSPSEDAKQAMRSTASVPGASGDTKAPTAAVQQATATAAPITPTTAAATATPVPPTATARPTQVPTPRPTNTPAPSPTPALQALKVLDKGFGQDRDTIGYAFILENPNPGHAAENITFQAAAYDAEGTVLKADSGSIAVLWPGQTRGIADTMYLPEGTKTHRIDVQVKPQQFTPFDVLPTFTVEKVTYRPDRYRAKATGIVKSPYKKDASRVEVSAVAYDKNDKIIGGGDTYVDFVPAEGQAAVEVSLTTSGAPTRLEMYAGFTNFTVFQ